MTTPKGRAAPAAAGGQPALSVPTSTILEGEPLVVTGSGWRGGPVTIAVDGRVLPRLHATRGTSAKGGVAPDASGTFAVRVPTFELASGRHRVTASVASGRSKATATGRFDVEARARVGSDGRPAERPYWRAYDFFQRRFGHIGFVPEGLHEARLADLAQLRELRDRLKHEGFGKGKFEGRELNGDFHVVFEGCAYLLSTSTWTPVGAAPVRTSPPSAGRTLSIAIDPEDRETVYIGTAGGGVWKSTDGGGTWTPRTDQTGRLAVGAIALAPDDRHTVYAGTGEYMAILGLQYYGRGVLRSTNGGDTWTLLGSDVFAHAEISRIRFDPGDPSRLFVASSQRL